MDNNCDCFEGDDLALYDVNGVLKTDSNQENWVELYRGNDKGIAESTYSKAVDSETYSKLLLHCPDPDDNKAWTDQEPPVEPCLFF